MRRFWGLNLIHIARLFRKQCGQSVAPQRHLDARIRQQLGRREIRVTPAISRLAPAPGYTPPNRKIQQANQLTTMTATTSSRKKPCGLQSNSRQAFLLSMVARTKPTTRWRITQAQDSHYPVCARDGMRTKRESPLPEPMRAMHFETPTQRWATTKQPLNGRTTHRSTTHGHSSLGSSILYTPAWMSGLTMPYSSRFVSKRRSDVGPSWQHAHCQQFSLSGVAKPRTTWVDQGA